MTYLTIPILFLADWLTKRAAINKLQKDKRTILNGRIHLKIVYNEGAFMGLLKDKKPLLTLLNIAALLMAVFFGLIVFLEKGSQLMKLGISFIIGGALGNVYDRIKKGKVTDFFSFKFKPNIYFNLADMFIFIGAFISVVASVLKRD